MSPLVALVLAAQTYTCDGAGLQALRASAEKEPRTLARPDFFGAALAETCSKKLPAVLRKALAQLPKVSPAERNLIAARAVEADQVVWLRACPDGVAAFAEFGAAPPAQKGVVLFERCKPSGLATREELATAKGPLVLALLVWDWMGREGFDRDVSRFFARGVGGIVERPAR